MSCMYGNGCGFSTFHSVTGSLHGPHGCGAMRPTILPVKSSEWTARYAFRCAFHETDNSLGMPLNSTVASATRGDHAPSQLVKYSHRSGRSISLARTRAT